MSFMVPTLIDALDITIMSVIIYYVITFFQRIGSKTIIFVVIGIFILYSISAALHLEMIASLFRVLREYWIIFLLIIFQKEIRNSIWKAGQTQSLRSLLLPRQKYVYSPILEAVASLSFRKTGALIVIENQQSLNEWIETGEVIDSNLSSKLLLTIFNKRTILHDGAAVIRQNRIYAVRVVLPLSSNAEYKQKYGTRHLAAIGISESTDALAIIVSEETGKISVAMNGNIESNISNEILSQKIADATRN